jgi:branched-chain amino acid aminotransferase
MTTEFKSTNLVKFFFDDRIIDKSMAHISILNPASQFGLSVFEGLRYYKSTNSEELFGFRVRDHYERLIKSAFMLDLNADFGYEFFLSAVEQTLTVNKIDQDAVVRAILFPKDEGSWTYKGPTSLFVSVMNRGRILDEGKQGLNCQISSWRRISAVSMPPSIKMGANYMNSRLGQLEAKANGAESAIFINERGTVSEGPGSCVAFIYSGKLIVSPRYASVLDSITINTILEIAENIGIEAEIREYDRLELLTADEAMLVGTTMEIVPIASLDRKPLRACPGPITIKLIDEYFRAVRGAAYSDKKWIDSKLKIQK